MSPSLHGPGQFRWTWLELPVFLLIVLNSRGDHSECLLTAIDLFDRELRWLPGHQFVGHEVVAEPLDKDFRQGRRVLCSWGLRSKILDRHRFFSYRCTSRMHAVGGSPIAGGDDAMDLVSREVNGSPIIDGEAGGDLSLAQ
jgi:hypothetical protein